MYFQTGLLHDSSVLFVFLLPVYPTTHRLFELFPKELLVGFQRGPTLVHPISVVPFVLGLPVRPIFELMGHKGGGRSLR